MMKTKEGIPIPTQIIQIIGEKNAADIYGGESSGEDSDVVVWHTNVNTFKLSKHASNKDKRAVIRNHLKAFHSYYLAEEQRKSAGGRKGSAEEESGYDSKDVVSPANVQKRKFAMPRGASPLSSSSQPDMFSTRSPSKANKGKASNPKKKVVRRKSTKKDNVLKCETNSSDDESGDEYRPSNQHTKTPLQQQNPSSKSKFSGSDLTEHEKSHHTSDQSNESDSPSNSSNSKSRKSSRRTTKNADSNIADSGASAANLFSQETVRQTNRTNDGSRSSSSDSDHEIIPATQDLSQRSTGMSLLGSGVDNTKNAKLDSTPKQIGRKDGDGNHSAKLSESKTGKTVHHSFGASKKGSSSSSTSDTEIDEAPKKALLINNSSTSGVPIPQKTESSYDSDSSDRNSHARDTQEIPLEGKVSKCAPHSSDSEDSDDQRNNESPCSAPTKPTKKEITSSSSNTSDSEDDEAPETLLINNPLPSGSPLLQKTESSYDSTSSSGDSRTKENKEKTPDGTVSKSTPRSSDSEDPDGSRKNGSQCSASTKPTKNETISSNTSDSEDDEASEKASFMNKSLPSDPIPQKTESLHNSGTSEEESSPKNSKDIPPGGPASKLIPHRSDSEDSDDANDSGSSSSAPTKPTENARSSNSSNSSHSTSESDDSDHPVSKNPKSSASLTKNQSISPRGKEKNRKNSSSHSSDSTDDEPQKHSVNQRPISLSNNSRKRKVDTVSSSDKSDSEPKIKVRKTLGCSEKVPFNSTRNPEVDEAGFPGSDLSVIPKINEPTNSLTTASLISKSSAPSKGTGSHMPKAAQISIREFAKPINPVSHLSSQSAYEAFKQEYYNSGFSNFKEPFDSESYDGLLEEDLLDKDVEVYVVQCPKEVDPTSLVSQEIDVSRNETVVELSVVGRSKVRHDVYCDLSDFDVGINVVVPSRTRKKFTLNSVPVSGRLTIVESVDVPPIEEFDSSSPPPVPFPENLKTRNTFVGSDESSAQSIVSKSIKTKSNDGGQSYQEMATSILDTFEAPKYEPVYPTPEKVESRKKRKLKDCAETTMEGMEETKYIRKEDDSFKSEDDDKALMQNRKAKRKLEENNDAPVTIKNLKEETDPPPGVSSEESLVKKKKKKKKKMHEYEEPSEAEHDLKRESVLPPAINASVEELGYATGETEKKEKRELEETNDAPVEEPTGERKKKKKKKRELEETIDAPVEEPAGEIKKKKKKKRELEETDDVPVEEPTGEIKKKKKKKKRELEETNDAPVEEPSDERKKKKRELEETNDADVEEPTGERKKKKKKKKRRELEETNDVPADDPTVMKKEKNQKHELEEMDGVDFNSDENKILEKKKKKHKKEKRLDKFD